MSKNFYISDLHLGDLETMEIDNRPFETIGEQNRKIISNWNEVVGIDDNAYIIGDFSEYDLDMTRDILNRLNGNKIIILGNHDNKEMYDTLVKEGVVTKTYEVLEINDNGYNIIMCHYPIFSWKNKKKGSIHLYGHLHIPSNKGIRDFIESDLMSNSYNCGCMIRHINYKPRTLDEIIGMVK